MRADTRRADRRNLAFDAFGAREVARLSLPFVEVHAWMSDEELQDRHVSAAGIVPRPDDEAG